MSNVQRTSIGIAVNIGGQVVELRIHPNGTNFKAIPKDNTKPWRDLIALLYPDQPSKMLIPLNAANSFIAETKLRSLLAGKSALKVSQSTFFRYTRQRARFVVSAKSTEPAKLIIESATERMDMSNPRAAAFLIALKSSAYCRSAEMHGGEISIHLAPAHSTDAKRLETYESLLNLY